MRFSFLCLLTFYVYLFLRETLKTVDDVYTNLCQEMSSIQETTGIQIFTKVDTEPVD